MTQTEFHTWFYEQVTPRWPNWEIGAFEVGDWFAAFGRFSRERLTRAIRRLRTHEPAASPNTKKLLEIVKSIRLPEKRKPVTEQPRGMSIRQIEANFPKLYCLKDRLELIPILYKLGRDVKKIDNEAYEIAVEKGLIVPKAETKTERQKRKTKITRQLRALRLGDCLNESMSSLSH